MREAGQRHAPAALCRRPGRPQGRSGQVRKVSLLSGFDPQTVQLVASPLDASEVVKEDEVCSLGPEHDGIHRACR
jgi:hypothetical protein